jgi:hypothetical protein
LELATKNNMLFFETSAKTSYNIDNVFNTSVKEISKKIDNGYYDLSADTCGIKVGMNNSTNTSSIQLDKKKEKKNTKNCC